MALAPTRKTSNRMNMLITPAWPGDSLLFLDSSLRLAAVSQPQKKKTPRTTPAASPSKPCSEKGLNHQPFTICDPVGWSAAILMKAAMEKPSTRMYSMATITHWKLAVSRMPRMTIQVTSASQASATMAISQPLPAASLLIQPSDERSARVLVAASAGAEMQKSRLAMVWTHPVNQPRNGLTVRLSQVYEAPQF